MPAQQTPNRKEPMIAHLTSNEYWGGLNRRFDRRAKLLRRLGFKYETTEYGGVFVRAKPWRTSAPGSNI